MKKQYLTFILFSVNCLAQGQKINWVCSTESSQWVNQPGTSLSSKVAGKADIEIFPEDKLQQMQGFGGCFNEAAWEALLSLPDNGRNKILNDLFSRKGLNFSFCRMPLGSNDYSLSYYSYDDVPDDFEMKNFNIDRDRYILVPYIRAAQKIRPDLKIWASPWAPPVWMKVNNHYAMGTYNGEKNLSAERAIGNNATAFKMENRYLKAYALYFSRFVKAYKKEGIDISLVMPQNEPIYQPHWQSCTWRPDDLAFFIGKFLGPQFQSDSLHTQIWLGTVNSADPDFTRTILNNKEAAKYIKGIGMQWDAKRAIGAIHKEYPSYSLMQTESECGNGENNWKSAEYTWSLVNQYISNGANSYMYWNMVLDESGKSTWGWVQNMLISVNRQTGEVKYNPEYYLMKHLSHFVQPGAQLLKTSGGKDHLAFLNPGGQLVLLLVNEGSADREVRLQIGDRSLKLSLKANSINTLSWQEEEK